MHRLGNVMALQTVEQHESNANYEGNERYGQDGFASNRKKMLPWNERKSLYLPARNDDLGCRPALHGRRKRALECSVAEAVLFLSTDRRRQAWPE
jgi:hypothetical protein